MTSLLFGKKPDLFWLPHKGFRFALFELANRMCLANFRCLDTCVEIRTHFQRFTELLTAHETIENKHIVPTLEKRVPGFTAGWFNEHIHLQQTELNLLKEINVICNTQNEEERVRLAAMLSSHFNHYISETLAHMRHEEEEWNLVMWVVFNDNELAEIQKNVMKEFVLIPDILVLIVRGLSSEERQSLVRNLECNLLPEEVPTAKKVIQNAISPEEWIALQQA
jgi:hypothetical protein